MKTRMDNGGGIRFDRRELAGSLGDLGTFIPLLVGMVSRCGIQLGPALLFAGLMNIATGLAFRIPMPVQPMKAIATVGIAEGLNESQIVAAGIVTGAVIFLLGASGAIRWFNAALPRSVVRGLQLALGLKLIVSGFQLIRDTGVLIGWDSIAVGVFCALLVLLFYFSTRVPGALIVFGVGLVALLVQRSDLLGETRMGIHWSLPALGNLSDWRTGFFLGAIPQIPLTTLNSVIAVCALSADLFPRRPAGVRRVATSVGLMNILCCPFGAMPMCHGAGGLAGQYRFGARTGGSVILLGIIKCALAVLFGGSLLMWLQAYPHSVLGVLLLFSGLELALVCRDQTARADYFVMLITAGACLAGNTALGFVIGWLMACLLLWGVFRIEPPPKNEKTP